MRTRPTGTRVTSRPRPTSSAGRSRESSPSGTTKGTTAHGRQQRRCVHRAGQGRGPGHRLPEAGAAGRPGGEPRQRRSQVQPRRHPQDRHHEHLRQRPAHGPRPHDGAGRTSSSGTRSPARSSRSGRDVEFIKVGDIVLRAVQHRLRPLPQLQGGQDRDLPERQPGAAGRGVRLRRHGRLGRRSGRVRDGPLRRLQPAAVPGQRPGDGEDQGPHAAVGHLPHRLPRRRHRGRRAGVDGVHRRRRAGRARGCRRGPAARCRGRDRRRPRSPSG